MRSSIFCEHKKPKAKRLQELGDIALMSGNNPEQVSEMELPEDPETRGSGLRRLLILAAIMLGAMTLAYFLPIRSHLQDPRLDRRVILSAGIWVYPASVAIIALLVGCGVPRLLLCGVAGMILGFWWGLAIVQIGTLLGYYGAFLFIRWGGRDVALRWWPALRKWADLARNHGVMGVILLRQLPIHGGFINLGLGLSHVKHRQFLIGTLIGSLPEAIPATLAGAGMVRASLKSTAGYLAIAIAGMALVWIACGYLVKAMRASKSGAEILAEAATLEGD
jgi:uncharacterized membrane protein YdjX (TVP38/TMEM64 family)